MIGQLTGTVAAVDSTTAVVDVNGIGFAVRMPNADLATLHIGNAAVVHTEMRSEEHTSELQSPQ